MCHRSHDRKTTQGPIHTPCVSQCPEIVVIGVTVKGCVSAGGQYYLILGERYGYRPPTFVVGQNDERNEMMII